MTMIGFVNTTVWSSEADFNGSRIVNNKKDNAGTAVADGVFTGTTTLNYTNGSAEQGAVHVSTPGLKTELDGKIDIKASNPSSSATYVHGVDVTTSGTVLLKGDISIEVNSFAGSGVKTTDSNAYVKLDAGDSGKTIMINLTNVAGAANNTNEAAGIYASLGRVDVVGNLKVNPGQSRAYGLWTGVNTSTGQGGIINVQGNTQIDVDSPGGYGVRVDGGIITLNGDLNITTTGSNSGRFGAYGIKVGNQSISYAGTPVSGTMIIAGSSTIATSGSGAYALYTETANSKIVLGDGNKISTTGNGAHGAATYYSYILRDSTGGTIVLGNNTTIETGGVGSHALYAGTVSSGSGGVSIGDNAVIKTSGSSSYGAYSVGRGLIAIGENASIATTGNNAAYGIYANGGVVTVGKDLSVNTSGSAAHAIYATGSASRINLNGIKGISTAAANALAISATNRAVISGTGQFTFNGGVRSSGTANVDLTMKQNSSWSGSTTAVNSGTVKLILSDNSQFNGTAVTDTNGYISLTVQDNGQFIGSTGTTTAADILNVNMAGQGLWTVNDNSTLTTLTMNHGTVAFDNGGAYKRITAQTLTGAGGTFVMNTHIAANNLASSQDIDGANSDFITVSGTADGTHVIGIRDSSNGGITGNEYALWLVNTGSSTSNSTFSGTNNVTQGATTYTYTVMNGDAANDLLNSGTAGYTVAGGGNDWYLLLTSSTTSNGGETVNNLAIAPHAAWFVEMDTLLKRMGELRLGGSGLFDNNDKFQQPAEWQTWVRSYGSQYNIGSQVSGSPFRQYIYGADIGADRSWLDDEKKNVYFTGIYGGYGRADQSYRSYAGEGRSNSYYGGFYGTWLNDAGWYADLVGKASYYDNSFEAWDDSTKTTGDYGNWAAGISLELGRQFKFKDGWYAEPQVQASYVHFFGGNYTTGGDNGFAVGYSDADLLQFRYGSLFGRTIKLDKEDPKDWGFIQPYVKIFGQNQISSGGYVRAGGGEWRPNMDGWAAVVGAGIVYQIDEQNQLHLDYEATFANKYDKPWGLNFGYRHQF